MRHYVFHLVYTPTYTHIHELLYHIVYISPCLHARNTHTYISTNSYSYTYKHTYIHTYIHGNHLCCMLLFSPAHICNVIRAKSRECLCVLGRFQAVCVYQYELMNKIKIRAKSRENLCFLADCVLFVCTPNVCMSMWEKVVRIESRESLRHRRRHRDTDIDTCVYVHI